MKSLIIILSVLVGSGAFAQSPLDYPSKVCQKAAVAAVFKTIKPWLKPSLSDYNMWDKKANTYASKYTGYFEVVMALESTECYEGYEVKTKLEYKNESHTPSCKIISVTYKDKDCA